MDTAKAVLELRDQLLELRLHALEVEGQAEAEITAAHVSRQPALRNLVNYLAVRQLDITSLQRNLRRCGFSSLGTIQGHVMASVDTVLGVLDALTQQTSPSSNYSLYPTIDGALTSLRHFADETLGPCSADGAVRIMVTMPSEAAVDPRVIDQLLGQGMTVMRVNCAHDGPDEWSAMIEHLRHAERTQGRSCRVSFDLAGPKLRTGPIAPGPAVLKFQPARDHLGRVTRPAMIRFALADEGDEPDRGFVPLSRSLLQRASRGDVLVCDDSRGRRRELVVETVEGESIVCTTDRTAYLISGLPIELWRADRCIESGTVGHLPATEAAIPLQPGDTLVVTRDLSPGRPAILDENGAVLEPARIGCSLPAVFPAIRANQRVLLDDGKFEGTVQHIAPDWFSLRILRAGRGRASLKAEKGINLPDTPIDLPCLTDKDLEDLEFVARHGDLVALSFVHDAADIDRLCARLDQLDAPDLGVILKIENRIAFERLPELLMTAAKRRLVAVMVARGDLGIEIGFERLAEVQEEILWLAEASHVPVIWATQVLESLAKDGLPSRAEVTDAAMSVRSECVMLNKGPHIGEAIRFLRDVSRRMDRHASKTFATHRRLNVADTDWLEVDRSSHK